MDQLQHHGVKGMKWGVRRDRSKGSGGSAKATAYAIGAKLNPREAKYTLKRTFTKPTELDSELSNLVESQTRKTGVLTSNKKLIEAIDRQGMQAHKDAKYDNLTAKDIKGLKKYTDAAYYSRAINTYLATGEGTPDIKQRAAELKTTLGKNKLTNQTVYRSTALKFSTQGLSKKLDQYGEEDLAKVFDQFDSNFKGKSFKENRVYSTSTSPSFAIDTWRKVNPNAAKTYNSYLVIDCKGTPGLLADGRTTKGEKIVNTRSNQEGILAPNKMTYRKLSWDAERQMFAVYMDAE